MPVVEANGIEICYEENGSPDDAAVLLVTGFKGQLTGFHPDLCALLAKEGLRVVRFDNRDSGLSSKTPADVPFSFESPPYTATDLALDAVGLLDALGIDAAHVVGVSMGGIIGQTLAINHPSRVLSLASIMSTTGDPTVGGATPEAEAVALAPVPEGRTPAIEHHVEAHRLMSGKHFDEAQVREDATIAFDRSNYPQGGMYQVVAVLADGDRTDRLGAVSCPTVVIHGEVDPLVNPSGGEATAKAIPGAELVLIPDMGHELPRVLFAQLVEAIARNIRRAS